MDNYEIFDVLKTSRKYSKPNFIYISSDDCIIYTPNSDECDKVTLNQYKISIKNDNNGKVYFYYDNNYELNISSITISFIRYKCTPKTILLKFGQMIKHINKLNDLIIKSNEVLEKSKIKIKLYLKSKYNLEPVFNEESYFKFKFPNSLKKYRRRYKTISYNIQAENVNKIILEIHLIMKNDNVNTNMVFNYSVDTDILTLKKINENYRNLSKDISKIIRSEKLKNIMFLNE